MKGVRKMSKIGKMKQEYENIQIPKELENKVRKSIMKAKKENRKNKVLNISKWSISLAAAAMLTIVVLANSSQTIAYAMEQIPVIGAITKVVTFRTYEDKTKDFEAKIDVPQIEVEEQEAPIKDSVEKVNKSIEEYTDMLIAQYEADLKASEGEGNYAMDTSYEVITDNDKMLTIRLNTVVAMGGSNSYSKIYHIDKETDSVITLEDMFKEGSDYKKVISENIISQMKEQMAADENITYFYDSEVSEWNFKEIKDEQNFYINDQGEIVIVFDKYEVAAGYMGMVEFAIPKDVTADIIK